MYVCPRQQQPPAAMGGGPAVAGALVLDCPVAAVALEGHIPTNLLPTVSCQLAIQDALPVAGQVPEDFPEAPLGEHPLDRTKFSQAVSLGPGPGLAGRRSHVKSSAKNFANQHRFVGKASPHWPEGVLYPPEPCGDWCPSATTAARVELHGRVSGSLTTLLKAVGKPADICYQEVVVVCK
eukprot:1575451-Heterocapsa_arctica.AAC.1